MFPDCGMSLVTLFVLYTEAQIYAFGFLQPIALLGQIVHDPSVNT